MGCALPQRQTSCPRPLALLLLQRQHFQRGYLQVCCADADSKAKEMPQKAATGLELDA